MTHGRDEANREEPRTPPAWQHHPCAWRSGLRPCGVPATVSASLTGPPARPEDQKRPVTAHDGGPWYCSWHWAVLASPHDAEVVEIFADWLAVVQASGCSLWGHYTPGELWRASQGQAGLPSAPSRCRARLCLVGPATGGHATAGAGYLHRATEGVRAAMGYDSHGVSIGIQERRQALEMLETDFPGRGWHEAIERLEDLWRPEALTRPRIASPTGEVAGILGQIVRALPVGSLRAEAAPPEEPYPPGLEWF